MKNKKININILLFLFPFLIIIGKIIRWTLMKTVLVDAGVGHYLLPMILNDDIGKFQFFLSDFTSNAGGNTVIIFQLINKIFQIESYVGFEVIITIIWNLIILNLICSCKKQLNLSEFIFLAISIIVLNIFDFCLAKEPIQMLYFLLIYFVLRNKKIKIKNKKILSLLVILLSVMTFRTYYIFVFGFTIVIDILCNIFIIKKEKVKTKDIMFVVLIIGLIFLMMLNIVKVVSPKDYAELLRVRLRTSSATSDMRSIFNSTNHIIFTIDYLIMLIRMICPVELLGLGIKYIPYVIYQVMITICVIKSLKDIRKNTKEQNIALFIFLGFLFASATFEPDFGSWVRHEAVTFPILLIMSGLTNMEKKV